MDSDKQRAFLIAIAGRHDGKLRRFLKSRLRNAVADVPDLMQEVFLRMMRVPNPESIRKPEAYLFTVAKAVLHQHRAQKDAAPEAVDIMDVLAELQEEGAIGPEGQLDDRRQRENGSAAKTNTRRYPRHHRVDPETDRLSRHITRRGCRRVQPL